MGFDISNLQILGKGNVVAFNSFIAPSSEEFGLGGVFVNFILDILDFFYTNA